MTALPNRHLQAELIEMVKNKLVLERIALHVIDINIRDENERNALYWAIRKQSTHNANLLIEFGSSLMVEPGQHALFHAIEHEHFEVVVLLVQKRKLNVNMCDKTGKTLLMYAIEAENFRIIKFLVDQGADLYLLDNDLNMAEDYIKKSQNEMIRSYFQHIVYKQMHNEKHMLCGTCTASVCNV